MSLSNIFSIICFINFLLLELIFNLSEILPIEGNIIYAAFFLITPLVLLATSFFNLRKTINGQSWPHARGVISNVELDDGFLDRIFGCKFTITYDYYVHDRHHSNNQFNPLKSSIKEKDLFYNPQLRNKSFTQLEGTAVKVFFEPKNPWNSMLCNKIYFEFNELLLPSINAFIITTYLLYSFY